ncbi:hypothetical protein V6N13_098412 [Hibiscus sabdariffa]
MFPSIAMFGKRVAWANGHDVDVVVLGALAVAAFLRGCVGFGPLVLQLTVTVCRTLSCVKGNVVDGGYCLTG